MSMSISLTGLGANDVVQLGVIGCGQSLSKDDAKLLRLAPNHGADAPRRAIAPEAQGHIPAGNGQGDRLWRRCRRAPTMISA